MPFTGTLGDLSLANLVQLQCREPRPTQVVLSWNGHNGKLIFTGCELVFATTDDKRGEEALFDLLQWEEGYFRVENSNLTIQRNINTPTSALLIAGLNRVDESRAPQSWSDGNWEQTHSFGFDGLPSQNPGGDLKPNRAPSKILFGMIGIAVFALVLIVLVVFASLSQSIARENQRLENQVDDLATQIALLQIASPTPTLSPVTGTPLAPIPSLTTTLVPTPIEIIRPPETRELSQPTAIAAPVPWVFQGIVFQWNGNRQNSTDGIKDMPIFLLDNCKSSIPLAQTKTGADGHFKIEYDLSSHIPAVTKFCVIAPGTAPWNSPKSAFTAVNWKEVSPGAIETTAPFDSPDKVAGQNIFYFSIKRTFSGKVLDEHLTPVSGTKIALRILQGDYWNDVVTTTTKVDGTFTLGHESSTADGSYYQIRAMSLSNYEIADRYPDITGDEWRCLQDGDRMSQAVESIHLLSETDYSQAVTFYQRLRKFEFRPSRPMNLYSDATGNTVKATLAPNSSFQYKILNRSVKRTQVLIFVTTNETILPKTGLVNPEKPQDIKNATFGEAKLPIYIIAADSDHLGWGWIEGYLDN